MKKWSAIVPLLLLSLLSIFMLNKEYYPELPINSVSKSTVIAKINNSSEPIEKIKEENGYEWYITRMEQGRAYENLKEMMKKEGWKFKEQVGSGFIFERDSEELIASTQMWTRKYVIIKLPIKWDNP